MKSRIARGVFLYHSVHGLCVVRTILPKNLSGEKIPCCEIIPQGHNRMNIRFVVPLDDILASGFHFLVSLEEAGMILEYLKSHNKAAQIPVPLRKKFSKFDQNSPIWVLAKQVLSYSRSKDGMSDQRNRQSLKVSVVGLVQELATILKISITEVAAKIQGYLGRVSDINPRVLTALKDATED